MTSQGRDGERRCGDCGHALARHNAMEGACLDCQCLGWTWTPPAPSPVEGETERRCDLAISDGTTTHHCSCDGTGSGHGKRTPPASPAVGETRVEWGVRCPTEGFIEETDEECARAWLVPDEDHHVGELDVLLRRTITTYPDGSFLTSAWVPVTDKETEA